MSAGLGSVASCVRTQTSRCSPDRVTSPTLVPRSAFATAWPISAWVKPRSAAFLWSTWTSSTLRCSARLLVTLVSPGMPSRAACTCSAPLRSDSLFSPLTVTEMSVLVEPLAAWVMVSSPAVSPSSANSDSSFGFTTSAVAPSFRLTVISAVLAPVPATA